MSIYANGKENANESMQTRQTEVNVTNAFAYVNPWAGEMNNFRFAHAMEVYHYWNSL